MIKITTVSFLHSTVDTSELTNDVLYKSQESFYVTLISLCDHVTKLGECSLGLREDKIYCISALAYAKDPQFVPK